MLTTTLRDWHHPLMSNGDDAMLAGRHDTQLVKIAPSGGRLVFTDKPGTHVFQSEVSYPGGRRSAGNSGHLHTSIRHRLRRRSQCDLLCAQVEAFAHVAATEGERPEVSLVNMHFPSPSVPLCGPLRSRQGIHKCSHNTA